MKAFGYEWDWRDWSLSVNEPYEGRNNFWRQLFSLRCSLCLAWCAGCREHWFCGLCDACRASAEDETGDDAS